MQKLLDQLVLQHFLRDCHEVGPPAELGQHKEACSLVGGSAGTPRLRGSRNRAPSVPPGGVLSSVLERMPQALRLPT